MRILIATPLYPPDTAEPALYVKELACRLAKEHQVTIATYGHLPEPVPGVTIRVVSKLSPLAVRLSAYVFLLLACMREADIVYVENGASTELPAVMATLLMRRPFILHVGDERARVRARRHAVPGIIERLARNRAMFIMDERPLPRPEIIPFKPLPASDQEAYEASWRAHLTRLGNVLNHA